MLTKSVLIAASLALVAPFAASANEGVQMEARLLNVEAGTFTPSELGQIAAEKGTVKRQEMAKFILESKSRGGSAAVANDQVSTFGANLGRVGRDG